MLKHHKVIPVVIFDGAYLPSKAGTEHERREYVTFVKYLTILEKEKKH
jgi:hypothetical protein